MDSVNAYMRELNIPVSIQDTVRGYYDFLWSRHSEGSTVLDELPMKLQAELAEHTHKHMLGVSVVFASFGTEMVQLIALGLRQQICIPNEDVYAMHVRTPKTRHC